MDDGTGRLLCDDCTLKKHGKLFPWLDKEDTCFNKERKDGKQQ
jgi:hypothetical protein